MKTAVVFTNGIKQIMLTPENESEAFALKMITPQDDIELQIKKGRFSNEPTSKGFEVSMCRGGYLRAFEDEHSLMLVLKPKQKKEDKMDRDAYIQLDRIENKIDYLIEQLADIEAEEPEEEERTEEQEIPEGGGQYNHKTKQIEPKIHRQMGKNKTTIGGKQ